jgi:hypothetical protein
MVVSFQNKRRNKERRLLNAVKQIMLFYYLNDKKLRRILMTRICFSRPTLSQPNLKDDKKKKTRILTLFKILRKWLCFVCFFLAIFFVLMKSYS